MLTFFKTYFTSEIGGDLWINSYLMKVVLQLTKTGDDWHDIDHIPSRVPFWDENVDFIPYPQFVCFSSQIWIPSPWPALFDGQSKTGCFCLSAMLARQEVWPYNITSYVASPLLKYQTWKNERDIPLLSWWCGHYIDR